MVEAPNGMVCSVDHLATGAGVAALRSGGSAADAAVAANAVLAVTSPHMCGMGGDLFALVHAGEGPPAALNASGRAGSGADAAALRAEGHEVMPFRGDIRTVPVPGCVDGWVALHGRFGRLPWADVLAPAIGYARDGFPASPLLAAAAAALPVGVPPTLGLVPGLVPGARVRRPALAAALLALAADGRDAFYHGPFGEGLQAMGDGLFIEADLATSAADWVEPLGRAAFGQVLWTMPPNSQGYLILAAAIVAEGLDLGPDDDRRAHLLVEAARAVGWDRPAVLHEGAEGEALLDPARLDAMRAGIDEERRSAGPDRLRSGGTTHLVAVDGEGMGVSLIQSNAAGFGTYLFEPATGIGLHNRGLGFSLDPAHPACLGPGRRPPSTLAPALVTTPGGALHGLLGTQGGDAQPQVVLQLLVRWLHDGVDPGTALVSPRWMLEAPEPTRFDTWDDPVSQWVRLESHAPRRWVEGLRRRGHPVDVSTSGGSPFGYAHLIEAGPAGWRGASDPRAMTGAAQGW